MMKLSKNFTLSEYTKSQTALRHGIDNTPGPEHLAAALRLFQRVVQPVRDNFGVTIITSGYRSPDLNHAIGGSPRSQHSKGEAADFECIGHSNYEVAKWIEKNLDFDQLILEFYKPGIPDSGWIHVSYRESGNRKSVLTAIDKDGDVEYKPGLLE